MSINIPKEFLKQKRQQAKESVERAKLINSIYPCLPDTIFGNARLIVFSNPSECGVSIHVPYNLAKLPEYIAYFNSIGWKEVDRDLPPLRSQYSYWPYVTFGPRHALFPKEISQYNEPRIVVRFDESEPGSVCHRHKLGTRTEVIDVYEYICEEIPE